MIAGGAKMPAERLLAPSTMDVSGYYFCKV
jgi:hypothetical protein